MNPRLLIRRGKEALPIIVEGEEPSSPSSFTKRFGFGSKKIRNKEPKSKPTAPIRSRPHIVIRVESEDRSDRESQNRHRPASERSRSAAETGSASGGAQKESAGQSPYPDTKALNVPSKGLAPVLEEDDTRGRDHTSRLAATSYESEDAANKPIEGTTSSTDKRRIVPVSSRSVTFENNISMWEDDSQWVAFEDATFSSELESRSSLSFFGADVFADLPTATLSDQSLTPSLLRNSTNQSTRSQTTRRVDVDELFKRDALPPSSSLRASSFQSASSFHSPSSLGSAVSHAASLPPPDPVLMDRVSEDAEEEEEEEDGDDYDNEVAEVNEGNLQSPLSRQSSPKSILRNSGYASKDRKSTGDDVGCVSDDDGISDILGDYDPSLDPEESGDLLPADLDQAESTHAEDGSYDTTDIESDEDYDETEGNNGTDTEGGLEASDSFESATLLDMLGEAVIAIWEDLGPPEPKASRRRSRPAHSTKERSHRTRRTYE